MNWASRSCSKQCLTWLTSPYSKVNNPILLPWITPCQAVGGLGAWELSPPGSRIISSVSPNLTRLGDSIEMDWEKLAIRVAWGLSVWEHMRTTRTVTAVTVDIVRMFYAPGLCQAPCIYFPCDPCSWRPQDLAVSATFLGSREPLTSSQWPHLTVSSLNKVCHSVKWIETMSFISFPINYRLKLR